MPAYAELQVTTNYSFLRGGSHADELVLMAKARGLTALAVADRNTLAGVVRAHVAAKKHDMRLIIGARLDLTDGFSLLCYPKTLKGYGRLSTLLSTGQLRTEKGKCDISLADVAAHTEEQIFIVVPPDEKPDVDFEKDLQTITTALNHAPLYLGAHMFYRGDDRQRLKALSDLSAKYHVPLVATNDVLYHEPARKALQDVITCIREGCRIEEAGFHLTANSERYIKSPETMTRLFKGYEDALHNTIEIANQCTFSMDELAYNYPDEPVPPGKSPQEHLEDLAWEGAAWRYGDTVPPNVVKTIRHELDLIQELNYAPYFLTVYDIVKFARKQGILCQGRGSAANSAVCYCLAITSVDPHEIDLLFERFISAERSEPPDIDVDFEHERREDVIQYIYRRYGRDKAGMTATVTCYRRRSAVREVGKVMGLSEDVVGALAGTVWGQWKDGLLEEQIRGIGLNPDDTRLMTTLALTEELVGFPRHLSQHVGGFVLTRTPLHEIVPIGNAAMEDRTVIEWDKDDLDALKLLKVDVLALGMLTCIRKCFDLLRDHYDTDYNLATVPKEDPMVYDMLCNADSIGVFQVESRAQMNMLPRLRPRKFYDLVIEVAIVRPGPIQGDMVHPYLRRRNGEEAIEFPAPHPDHGPPDELEKVLEKTKGVPLFQEQAMRLAIEAAKFTPSEANELRHAMATFRRRGTIDTLKERMINRMIERGYEPDFAARCYSQIEGFGEYGFPESHAASFALLVYVSSWLKCHYPDVFACGILNSQPMGFYAPAQLIRDAKDHGVPLLPVDVNHSDWNNKLERLKNGRWALRIGMRQVDGLKETDAADLIATRYQPFSSVYDLWERSGVGPKSLEKLAAADAYRSLGLDRRQALWEVRALHPSEPLPLFAFAETQDSGTEESVQLPSMPLSEHVVNDYQTLRFSLKAHPMSFLRDRLTQEKMRPAQDLLHMRNDEWISLAGLVIVRQRPGTAQGIIFMTLEDETGIANVVIWPQVLEKYRPVVMSSRLIMVRGRVQKHQDVIHIIARDVKDYSPYLSYLSEDQSQPRLSRKRPTLMGVPSHPSRHPRNVRTIPKSRDFH